jgi:phospholipid/cholesterol/gamma-HCH transport system substrate-binding protein
MEARREQVFVGTFVLVAAAVLIATVFAMSGAFGRATKTYHAYFPFAGGIEPGATVRYSGGPKIGRVQSVKIDPKDPGRFDLAMAVQSDVPVKSDSRVKIMSMSPLGDNHVEILPGTSQAATAGDNAVLASIPYVDFNSLTAQINDLAPEAKQLVQSLNERVTELKETLARVNDLLNPQNRANLAATIANARAMLEEDRPEINSALKNVNGLTVKLDPLIQDFRKTAAQADEALKHVDAMIGENRPDIRKAVIELRRTLGTMTDLTAKLDQTLDVNADNIDEVLDNMRHVTENLREFTATIKTRPYTLIRASNPKEHKPGEQP